MNKEPDVRWPAEWEPQDAVWLSWPHRRDLWQGGLDELQRIYGLVAASIAPHAQVRVNAAEALHPVIRQVLQAEEHALAGAATHVGGGNPDLGLLAHGWAFLGGRAGRRGVG